MSYISLDSEHTILQAQNGISDLHNNEMHTCSSSQKLQQQQNTKQKDLNYICNHCLKGFRGYSDLKQHEQAKHAQHYKIDYFSCGCCSQLFITKLDIEQHYSEKHPQEANKLNSEGSETVLIDTKKEKAGYYACEDCHQVFNAEESLNQHNAAKHPQLNVNKVTLSDDIPVSKSAVYCFYCSKQFTTLIQLESHNESVHKNKDYFPCSYCSKPLLTHTGKLNHMHLVHFYSETVQNISSQCTFSCAQCFEKFTKKTDLEQHLKNSHATFCLNVHFLKAQINVCSYCHEKFFKDADVKQHLREIHDIHYVDPTEELTSYENLSEDIGLEQHLEEVSKISFGKKSEQLSCFQSPSGSLHSLEGEHRTENHNFLENGADCKTMFGSYLKLHKGTGSQNTDGIICEDFKKGGNVPKCGPDRNSVSGNHFQDEEKRNENIHRIFYVERKKNEKNKMLCRYCATSFTELVDLQQHKVSSHKILICEHCNEEFQNWEEIFRHNIKNHKKVLPECMLTNLKGQFPCILCDIKFPTQDCRGKHYREAHMMVCSFCHKNFFEDVHLKHHLQETHNIPYENSTENELTCWENTDVNIPCKDTEENEQTCIQKFSGNIELKNHKEVLPECTLPNPKEQFSCIPCDMKFPTLKSRGKHYQEAHIVVCSYCNQNFFKGIHLKQHLQQVHNIPYEDEENQNIDCNLLENGTEMSTETVLGDSLGQCRTAEDRNIDPISGNYLQEDSRNIDIISCEYGEMVLKKSDLNCALEDHIQEDEKIEKKNIENISHEKVEQKKKNKQKNFLCEYCDKSFKKLKQLGNHVMDFHTLIKCNTCAETFANWEKIYGHTYQIHKKSFPDCIFINKSIENRETASGVSLESNEDAENRNIDSVTCEDYKQQKAVHECESNQGKHFQELSRNTDVTSDCIQAVVCPHCNMHFPTENLKKVHIDACHLNCNSCQNVFVDLKSLRKHQEKKHKKVISNHSANSQPSHICAHCCLPFSAKEILEEHEKLVHGSKRFEDLKGEQLHEQLEYTKMILKQLSLPKM